MFNQTPVDKISFFTLSEIRLIRQMYEELTIDQLATFFRKSSQDISELAIELGLKKEEVSNG